MEGFGDTWVGYGPCPRRGSWAGQEKSRREQGFGNGTDARFDSATATAAAPEEAMATMCSIIRQKARSGSMFAIFGRGGTKRGAPDDLSPSVKPYEIDPVLGA